MSAPPPAPSAHFLNNVLATAASHIDEDGELARDVLAELGQFLAYRLRPDTDPVPLAQELDFVGCYLRLEAHRFPGRLALEMPAEVPDVEVPALSVQDPLHEALTRRLREPGGTINVRVRAGATGATYELEGGQATWTG